MVTDIRAGDKVEIARREDVVGFVLVVSGQYAKVLVEKWDEFRMSDVGSTETHRLVDLVMKERGQFTCNGWQPKPTQGD